MPRKSDLLNVPGYILLSPGISMSALPDITTGAAIKMMQATMNKDIFIGSVYILSPQI